MDLKQPQKATIYAMKCQALPYQKASKWFLVLPKPVYRHINPMCEDSTTPPAVPYAVLLRNPVALLRLVLLEPLFCSGGIAFTALFASSYILIPQQSYSLLGNQLPNLINSLRILNSGLVSIQNTQEVSAPGFVIKNFYIYRMTYIGYKTHL